VIDMLNTRHLTGLQTDSTELSRRAAERHAVPGLEMGPS